jgi:hypothetical protein
MRHLARFAFSAVAAYVLLSTTAQFGDHHGSRFLNSFAVIHSIGPLLLVHFFFAALLLTCLLFPPLRIDRRSDERWASFLAYLSLAVSTLGILIPFLGAVAVGFGHLGRSRSVPNAAPLARAHAFIGLVLGYLGLVGWSVLAALLLAANTGA